MVKAPPMPPEALPDLILASASPRRRELLERLGLTLEIAPAAVDETPQPGEKPLAYARRVAAWRSWAPTRPSSSRTTSWASRPTTPRRAPCCGASPGGATR